MLLGGCSALRFGYGQAPELAYWWLDGYVDFNDLQTPKVRSALGQWFAWHRRTQLPDYAGLLASAQTDVMGDITPARACYWFDEGRRRAEASVAEAVPAAAELLLTLTPQQIDHLERRYAKANREYRDEYLGEPQERAKRAVRRVVERAELLYGQLDDAQLERIATAMAQSPFDAELWLSERQRRQQDALQMLRSLTRERAAPEQAQVALRAYVERVGRSPRELYRRYADRLQQYNCNFAAELHNSTQPAQRRAAALKLKGWEGDVRALAAQAAAP